MAIKMIPSEDMLIFKYFGEPYDKSTYKDGVYCKCGANIVFKNRKPYEPVFITCPECGSVIKYGI